TRPSVSNSLDWFPARVSIPGSSKEEILLTAIERLQTAIEKFSPMSTEQLQQSIDQMKQLFITDAPLVPTQPDISEPAEEQRVPNTVQKERVPDNIEEEKPTDHVQEQRVPDIDNSDTNEIVPEIQHPTKSMSKQRRKIRKQKAKEKPAYRSLTTKESKKYCEQLDY
ncbi:MAG: hypothetical protein ACK56F_24785, partial [bacterium]